MSHRNQKQQERFLGLASYYRELMPIFFKEQHYWQNFQSQQYMGDRKQVPDGSKPFVCSGKCCAQQVLKTSKFTKHEAQEKHLGLQYNRRTRERHTEYFA